MHDLFKHKTSPGNGGGGSFVPYLFEAFSTRIGAPGWASATGSYTANSGQALSNSGLSTGGYCLGDDGLLHLLGANAVRVEPSGLLVEGDGTNSLLYSNTFSNGAYSQDGGAVAQNVTGPDGVANSAWTWTANAGLAQHRMYQSLTTGNIRESIYAKAGTVHFLGLYPGGAAGSGSVFDLSNGTVAIDNGKGATIEAVGNGWYRCSFTANNAGLQYFIAQGGTTAGNCDGDQSWTAAGTETILLFGGQAELLAQFTSSYIPTTAAPANRNGDFVTASNPLGAVPFSAGVTATPLLAWTAFTASPFFFVELLSTYNPQGLDISTVSNSMEGISWGANTHFRQAGFTLPADKSTLVFHMQSDNSATPTITGDVNGTALSGLTGTGNAIAAQGATIHFGNYVFGDGVIGDGSFWGHLKDVFLRA